ncbi:MAG TPA: two-component regulator propeller domain-containing protein [Gemmatimonadaceae bacterium]|jgi:signal transduction histidine kinase/ligand-binding sensor domain-containing protein|nr:two-component regulator propeller domain-containing protein [Gemmatimonadaceae bacterium]
MHVFAATLLIGALVPLAVLGQAPPSDSIQPRPIHQLAHKTWVAQDGAPAEIRVLAQTGDGYLWLGTVSGLVRFDGVRFVPFQPRANDTLPTAGVRALTRGRDGTLWIVWETGAVSHLVGGRLVTFGQRDGLAPAYALAESGDGVMVAGTNAGLARLTNGRWKDVGPEWGFPGTEARAVWFDRSNTLWVESTDRVVYRPADAPRFLDPGWPLQRVAYQAEFAQDTDGTIWMAEMARSVHTLRRVGDTTSISEVKVGAYSLVIDRRGSLWIGSRGDGLRRVPDPSRIRGVVVAQFGPEAEQFTEEDGLLSNVIWDLLEDREGNIWVASDRGLERFWEGSLVPFTTRGGLRPRGVFANRDSSVWISAFATKEITRIGPRGRDGVHEPPCWCYRMAQDSLGGVWAFEDTMVVRFEGLKPTRVPLTGGQVLAPDAIAIDPSGTVWLTDQALGLVRIIDNRIDPVAPATTIGRFTALSSDRRGRIWVGSLGRVILYDHGELTVFGAAEGVKAGQISDVYEDRLGTVWAVGAGGIHKFEGGRFRTLHGTQGLPDRAAFGITEDDTGAWWLANRAGLLRLAPGELARAFADTGYTLRYRLFDRLDGLPGAIGMTKLKVLTRSADGRIWVGADEGVAYLDPRHLRGTDMPLNVLVETVRIDGREVAPSELAAVPPGSSALEIDYTATALSFPERVQFRYRLEGADPTWRYVGTRRRAYYTDLAPGSYRFHVSANSGDGRWTDAVATWSFRVLPAWYQTFWFRALAVLLIGSAGGLAVALVQRKRHARAQAELKRQYDIALAERVRIAEDLHDTLLQGFAGVNLQLIAAELALPSEPEVAAATLVRVQRLTEESLREARERVWEMRDAALAHDDLATALEAIARDRTAGMPMDVTVTTTGNSRRLPPSVEDASFRIGREAIVNVVRHADATRMEIHLDFRTNTFSLEVRDNGRGVNPNEATDARRRGHFGLGSIQNRASLMGGRCEVRPRPGGGTVVALELPIA